MALQNGRIVLSLGLAAVLGTLAAGQAPVAGTPTPADLLAIAERGVGLSVDGDTIHGIGPGYKACFSDAGIEFTPVLGKRAPRSYPLRFQLQSIRRGRELIYDTASTQSPRPRQDGNSVLFDRGPGLVERYDVRADGIEQSFVFDNRPAGSGELVVRGLIDTELEAPARGEANEGLSFHADGLGGVKIGAVFGVDALGRTVGGSMRWHGTHVELALPAEFVDNAAYPLVLDPFISSEVTVRSSVGRDLDPDVAFDEVSNLYLVVWERALSSGDVDILGLTVNITGVPVGGPIPIQTDGRVAINPTVASVAQGNAAFFVAWQIADNPWGPWNIQGRAVTDTGGLSPLTDVAGAAAVNETNPDVGGMSTRTDNKVVVVWEQDGSSPGLQHRSIALQGTAIPALGAPVPLTSNADDHNPAISKSAGAAEQHVIAWERHSATGVNIWTAYTDYTGSIGNSGRALANPTSADMTNPAVDGDGTKFMVVYEKAESVGSAHHGIYCQMLSVGFRRISFVVSETVVEDVPSDDQSQPTVAFLGVKYLVAWADQESSLSHHIYLRPLNAQCQPCGPRRQVSFGRQVNVAPEIAARYSGRSSNGFSGNSLFDKAMVVFSAGTGDPPFDMEIRGRAFEAIGSGGAVTNLGPGCGTGGTIATNGPVAVGNSEFAFTLTGADPGSLIYGIGLGLPGPTLNCGSCSFVDGDYNFVAPSGTPGTASYGIDIPCRGVLVGFQLDAQWIAFGTASSPCPLAATLSASNRIRVTVGL